MPEWIIKDNEKLSKTNNGNKANDKQLNAVQNWLVKEYGCNPFER